MPSQTKKAPYREPSGWKTKVRRINIVKTRPDKKEPLAGFSF
jgi:hypothetical protein